MRKKFEKTHGILCLNHTQLRKGEKEQCGSNKWATKTETVKFTIQTSEQTTSNYASIEIID